MNSLEALKKVRHNYSEEYVEAFDIIEKDLKLLQDQSKLICQLQDKFDISLEKLNDILENGFYYSETYEEDEEYCEDDFEYISEFIILYDGTICSPNDNIEYKPEFIYTTKEYNDLFYTREMYEEDRLSEYGEALRKGEL